MESMIFASSTKTTCASWGSSEMLVPLSWLREFVPYEGGADDLAKRLTMAGLEVDSILRPAESFEDVVVGEVLEVKPHPNAERLTLCTVTTGGEAISVVCGADNVAVGQKVPFAAVGAVLPGGVKIKKVKIRGEVSLGMICSEKELELGDDAEGIMVLSGDAPVGKQFVSYQGLDDEILDIEVTPNRPDALCIYGVARDVAALYGLPLKPWGTGVTESGAGAAEEISVTVEDPEGCPRYSARLIRGISVGPSPSWMAGRLRAVGLRPINAIVDITNYIMMEIGQPQHAFDLHQVAGGAIVVRRAGEGEALRTLDDEVRGLTPEVLMIADVERSLAVAGVMGGIDSQIGEDTTDIFLESAHFDPVRVSIGGNLLGMVTESRKRFERGTDPTLPGRAADRAAAFMAELAGGEVAPGIVEFVAPGTLERRTITVRKTWIDGLLGVEIPVDQAASILGDLGFDIDEDSREGTWDVAIPPWRPDVIGEAHVAEELARVYGYDEVGSDSSLSGRAPAGPTHRQRFREDLRDALVKLGLYEVMTNSLVERDSLHPFIHDTRPVILANPRSEDQSELRRDLLPGILKVVQHNVRRQMEDVRIFEIGTVHSVESGRAEEEEWVVGALTGARWTEIWSEPQARVDWFDLQGIISALVASLDIDTPNSVPYEGPAVEPGSGGLLLVGEDIELGYSGRLAGWLQHQFNLEEPVWVFGMRLDCMQEHRSGVGRYRGLPRYPASDRDVSVVIAENVPIGKVLDRLRREKRVEQVRLKGEYMGEQIPEGMMGVLLGIRYRDKDKTLSDKDIDVLHTKTVEVLVNEFGARLREESVAGD